MNQFCRSVFICCLFLNGLMAVDVQALNIGVASSNQAEIASSPGINLGYSWGEYLVAGSSMGVANKIYYSNQYTLAGYKWSQFGDGWGQIWLGYGLGAFFLKKGYLSGAKLDEVSAQGVGPAIKLSWLPFSNWFSISFENIYGINQFFYYNSWSTMGFISLEFML